MQVSRKFGNFSINLIYGRHRISQPMRIVTQKFFFWYLLIPWGGGVCMMQPSNVSIQQEKKDNGPTSLCFKRRKWWAHFTVLGASKCVHPAREENYVPTSMCLHPLNVSIQQEKKMTGFIRCAWSLQMIMWSEGQWGVEQKDMGMGYDRPPPPPDRHFDYYTESAEWANSVKI